MATALPATHLRVAKARALAAGEIRRLNLDCAEHGRVEQLCRAPSLVFDPIELDVTDGTDSNRRVVAPIDRDRRGLGGQPLCDQAAQEVLRQVDQPEHLAASQVDAIGFALLDHEGEGPRAPPLIGLSWTEHAGAGRLAATRFD